DLRPGLCPGARAEPVRGYRPGATPEPGGQANVSRRRGAALARSLTAPRAPDQYPTSDPRRGGPSHAAHRPLRTACLHHAGHHHRLDFLIGPGKALDTNKYLVVCTDAIGNGLTTSPSNSTAQPRMKFPRFTIRDMVQSQHRLLTEHLKIEHVVTVVGPSMGGMQA